MQDGDNDLITCDNCCRCWCCCFCHSEYTYTYETNDQMVFHEHSSTESEIQNEQIENQINEIETVESSIKSYNIY